MNGILVVLLILFALCLLIAVWVRWRYPVVFRLGVRNIPRRPAQSTLIVVGLMLSTLIIAAALGTGDTVGYSVGAETYNLVGHVDDVVLWPSPFAGFAGSFSPTARHSRRDLVAVLTICSSTMPDATRSARTGSSLDIVAPPIPPTSLLDDT